MTKALWVSRNIVVFIHPDKQPSMRYNRGKMVVSKQPNSIYLFCVDASDLEVLPE